MDIIIIQEKNVNITKILFGSEEGLDTFVRVLGPLMNCNAVRGVSLFQGEIVPSLTFYHNA